MNVEQQLVDDEELDGRRKLADFAIVKYLKTWQITLT